MQQQCTFTEANALKFPEQISIAIAKDAAGKYNPITLGWTMQTSIDPPMLAISIGISRYSFEVIRGAGAFVVAFPSELQQEETMFFGSHSGRDTDKIAESGVNTEQGSEIDGILLSDAVANFECTLAGELKTGDHYIFAGEVVRAHKNKKPRNRLYTMSTAGGFSIQGIPRR